MSPTQQSNDRRTAQPPGEAFEKASMVELV
jgi:hypothetical protein